MGMLVLKEMCIDFMITCSVFMGANLTLASSSQADDAKVHLVQANCAVMQDRLRSTLKGRC